MMLTEISAFILAVSLANERLLEIVKTMWPWLAIQHSQTDENKENSGHEKLRRIIIQGLSFLTGWISAAVLAADGKTQWINLWGFISFGTSTHIHVAVLGVLSSAGSVFWNQIVGYSKALKDTKKQEAQADKMEVRKLNLHQLRTNKYQSKQLEFEAETAPDFNQA